MSCSSSPSISNNILAFNSSGLHSTNSATAILRNNCVYNPSGANYSGLGAGTGDISVDPLFVNPVAADYHLAAASPCIDAGYNAGVPAGVATDLDGYVRFFDDPVTADCRWSPGNCGAAPVVDIGAYEYIPPGVVDLNHDNEVDAMDFEMFLATFGRSRSAAAFDPEADFDGDGVITLVDYQRWLQGYRQAIGAISAPAPLEVLGDFQRDGRVDATDLDHLRTCTSGAMVLQADPSCRDADLDHDGDVDPDDFAVFQRCYSGPAALNLACRQ